MGIYCSKCFKNKQRREIEKHENDKLEIKTINHSNIDPLFQQNKNEFIPENKINSNKDDTEIINKINNNIPKVFENSQSIETKGIGRPEIDEKRQKDTNLMYYSY